MYIGDNNTVLKHGARGEATVLRESEAQFKPDDSDKTITIIGGGEFTPLTKVRVFGHFDIEVPGQPLEESFGERKYAEAVRFLKEAPLPAFTFDDFVVND
jgi:hypothetical protein